MAEQNDLSTILGVINDFRAEVNSRFDKLVTKEAFDEERKVTRATVAQVKRDLANHEKESVDATRARAASRSKWVYGLVIAAFSVVLTGAITLSIFLIEAQQHLSVVKP